MKKYMIYMEEHGYEYEEFAYGYKELKEKLKDLHGYGDYNNISVYEILEYEDGDIQYIAKNYK